MTCGANGVFTKVLNILVDSRAIIEESFHYCFPFLDFEIEVIVFYKDVWTFFKLISKISAHILKSSQPSLPQIMVFKEVQVD